MVAAKLMFVGPQGVVLGMALAGLAMPLLVAAIRLWLLAKRGRRQPAELDEGTVEASANFRRYLVAAACADWSAQSWDHHVRPVLADLAGVTPLESFTPGVGARDELAEYFGEPLWALIDRDAPRSHSRSNPSGSRSELLEILELLESRQ